MSLVFSFTTGWRQMEATRRRPADQEEAEGSERVPKKRSLGLGLRVY